jgi:integrase
MAEATFVLKEPNGKEPTLIYLFYCFNKQRLKYSTGEKIKPKYWNTEKQRARETYTFSSHASINNTLDNLAKTVKEAHRDLINSKKPPTTFKLKDALDKSLYKDEYGQSTTFLKFVLELTNEANRKLNTMKQWKQTLRKLNEFQASTKMEVDFDTIDMSFYNSFLSFLTKQGYTKNTIGGFIKNVKIFMNEAVERNLTKNLEYRNKKFKVLEEQVDKIYLSQKELLKIYGLKFTSVYLRLDKVRDIFIVACYTGLRFSDLIQVGPENIINNGTQIKIKTEKTGELVIIPLHKFVKEIIKKYNGSLPPAISNQPMNRYLKEIAESAEINDPVKIAITRGGKAETNIFKKSDLVSTHTARRSFATNAYLMDVPTISIMKITGHRTEKSFMKYIRISQEENANKLINHPFFGN